MKTLFKMVKPDWVPYGVSTLLVSCRNFAINMLNAMLFSSIAYAARMQDLAALRHSAALFLGLLGLFVVIDTVSIHIQALTIRRMTVRIRQTLYAKYLRLPIRQVQALGGSAGDILTRLNSDVSLAENIFSFQFFYPVMLVFSGVGGSVSIFLVSPVIWVYLVSAGLIALGVKLYLAKKAYLLSQDRQSGFSRVMTMLNQLVSHLPNLRLMNLIDPVQQWIFQRLETLGVTLNRQAALQAKISFSTTIVDFAGYTGVLLLGLLLMQKGEIQLEEVLFLLQLAGMVTDMFLSLGDAVASLRQNAVGAERICEVQSLEEEALGSPDLDSTAQETAVCADHLSISFPDGTHITYPDHIQIPSEKLTAVYGSSGCGKSSFARILVGLHTDYSGTVTYGGRPLAAYSLAALRHSIAYVPQKDYFIPGTILENLTLGMDRPVSTAEAEQAAQALGCGQWICALPAKFDTVIPHGGTSLSGGQRQMLSVLRAVLRGSKTIILDETFANIDADTIPRIISGLKQLRRAVIVITHDQDIVRRCDTSIHFTPGTLNGR